MRRGGCLPLRQQATGAAQRYLAYPRNDPVQEDETIPYKKIAREKVKLPKRSGKGRSRRSGRRAALKQTGRAAPRPGRLPLDSTFQTHCPHRRPRHSAPTRGPLSARSRHWRSAIERLPRRRQRHPGSDSGVRAFDRSWPLQIEGRPTNLVVEAPIVKPTLMPDTVNG